MNDFDIDLFLPSLFFTILAQARGKARQTNKPTEIKKFIDALAHHPYLEGFDDSEGRKVLERLVRTTLISVGGVGRSSAGEQITSIVPYSLLAHKPGFPAEGSRQRSADTFIYQILREWMGGDDRLREFVIMVFGKGVTIGNIAELGGVYDGTTQLDTLARLSIAFLDGFENTRPGQKSRENKVQSPCPTLTKEFATDIYRYLFTYYDSMPVQAFTYHLLSLINFELFNYTLKLVHAVNELVQNPDELPVAMRDNMGISSPQLYLDFTESSTGHSLEMARSCVRRDIESYQQFLSSNLLLRQLDVYVEKLNRSRYKASIEKILRPDLSGGEYLQGLLQLRNDPIVSLGVEASANFDEDRIREANIQEGEDTNSEVLSWFDDIVNGADGSVERVVNLLAEGQQKETISKFIQWYWSVGGLKKPHGVLRGNPKSRKSWRYAPTNDLLAMLVQLAAAPIIPAGTKGEEGQEAQPIRLQEFLQFLEERFGILVDRPPTQFEGAEYAAAARDNLRAMLRRLRQMGIFHDLSDDFTVQLLHPPYASKIAAKVEV
ncbi:MAG: hypothetical protein NVS4B7_21060 [Ktedonobacteraceae bacterium]